MRVEAKDIIAIVTIICLTILKYAEKIPVGMFGTLLGAILGFYFGYRFALMMVKAGLEK